MSEYNEGLGEYDDQKSAALREYHDLISTALKGNKEQILAASDVIRTQNLLAIAKVHLVDKMDEIEKSAEPLHKRKLDASKEERDAERDQTLARLESDAHKAVKKLQALNADADKL
jgi:hypothetical protein